jgi:DNA-binding NarL/FixJ family response regulator
VIRVALAEDHTLVREGFRQLLALVDDITLVGDAADGEAAIALVVEQRPDVLLLDMRMPKADGLAVITALAARGCLVPTLVLTTFDDEHAALELMAAGARGFLLKDVTLDRLVEAVRVIAGGGTVLRPGLSDRVANQLRSSESCGPEITAREREVLRLLAAGYSNREIGRALFVAEGTVKNHVSNILTKLGVRDRTRAVLKALELGYV